MTHLTFDRVTVSYPVHNNRTKSLRNNLVRISTGGRLDAESGRIQVVTALQDVTLDLRQGDAVGLVGHNGAGKSTMLRTMAGVYKPTNGTVKRQGKTATVLELGAGIDPELTGYENITRMGVLLGMSIAETKARVSEIESFTQLGNFLQLPVRMYSSGMATRLMFAVATSTRPDILLVDEVFGAGDAEFQEKARQRMAQLISSVGIFVFASHDHELIRTYCNRYLRLEHGRVSEIDRRDVH
ncbi:ABC transporter ATP-binding protein [Paraburkholderia kirstenboschensis]|uniref:ABC transporter ATP-binding protein n=1 Tax=Paraburkholderia kirstenboschensis TaxID=1245436 RepID=A0ABZ0EAQ8_9BURK|nr:ABC transporter ATP-binding protein [Paraburkholderia kirstenboschensis]WOD14040.1 ABC transporter ATP-binding protein [Paraburkholderia kirstenboschensis]